MSPTCAFLTVARSGFRPRQAVAFNLIEAKRFRDAGEAARRAALADLEPRGAEGEWQPADPSLVLNALSDLSAAVLFSFASIEALANHTIDQLHDDATYEDSRGRTRTKAEMVRRLSIEEKLRGAVLLLTKQPRLDKGREPWQSFARLKDMRDDPCTPRNVSTRRTPTIPRCTDACSREKARRASRMRSH